jgi:hypothetical protein
VIEVWEPQEDAARFFRERFVPAIDALGLSGPLPRREFWPVHRTMK